MDPALALRGLPEDAAVAEALRGESIYGDDFDDAAIAAWYEDEREAYATLYSDETGAAYPYHQQNIAHGFARLESGRTFQHALGFGAAFGDELLPVIQRVKRVTIMDPSDRFVRQDVGGVPAEWVKPHPSGRIAAESGEFDLITCFGVLHHVPNVSRVVREFARVMSPGGYALIREPIVSMGDWRRPRRGLTKRERGIPLKLLESAVAGAGLVIESRTLCMYSPFVKLCQRLGISALNRAATIRIDAALSRLFAWNYTYHAAWIGRKFTPTSAFLVVRKPG